jgi:hypothetical protein
MIPWISVVFVVISPFTFLILLIRVFSLLILVRFARGLSILFNFAKNELFISLILCMVFVCLFVSISLILALIFIISLLLLVLGFACSCFYMSLRCSIGSLIWDLFVILVYALMAINFLLGLPLLCTIGSGRLCFHFH